MECKKKKTCLDVYVYKVQQNPQLGIPENVQTLQFIHTIIYSFPEEEKKHYIFMVLHRRNLSALVLFYKDIWYPKWKFSFFWGDGSMQIPKILTVFDISSIALIISADDGIREMWPTSSLDLWRKYKN